MARMGGDESHFTRDEFELVQLFAGQASIALRNAEAHGAVVTQAEHDALTGLRNHGAFQRQLDELLGRGVPFALLMLDLDAFKAYNDSHGHPAGDALLDRIAGAMRESLREGDRVYRYGGDEFAILLPRADEPGAREVAERVRAAVARLTADVRAAGDGQRRHRPLPGRRAGQGRPRHGRRPRALPRQAPEPRPPAQRRPDARPLPRRRGPDDAQAAGAPRAARAARGDRGAGRPPRRRQARLPLPARGAGRRGRRAGPRGAGRHRGVRGLRGLPAAARDRRRLGGGPHRAPGRGGRLRRVPGPRARPAARRLRGDLRRAAHVRRRGPGPDRPRVGRRRRGRSRSARSRRSRGSGSWRRSPSTTPGCSSARRPRSAAGPTPPSTTR